MTLAEWVKLTGSVVTEGFLGGRIVVVIGPFDDEQAGLLSDYTIYHSRARYPGVQTRYTFHRK